MGAEDVACFVFVGAMVVRPPTARELLLFCELEPQQGQASQGVSFSSADCMVSRLGIS